MMSIHLNTLMLCICGLSVFFITIEARSFSHVVEQEGPDHTTTTPESISSGTEAPYQGPYFSLIETSPICKSGFVLQANRCRKPA